MPGPPGWRLLILVLTLLTACRGGVGGDGQGNPSPEPSAVPSPTEPPSPNPAGSSPNPLPSPSPADLPEAVELVEQGDRYWAVYAVVAEAGSAELDEAFNRLRDLGVTVGGFGELACDRGAAEALGVDAKLHGVAVYFESKADAQAFADALAPPPVGIARVRTSCPD